MGYKNQEKQREYQRKYFQKKKAKSNDDLKKRRFARTQWFYELKKNLECIKCGENHPACLDFHHKDSSEKEDGISKLVSFAYSEERILNEIAKCDVLCSNCHRKFHWDERLKSGSARLKQE